MDVLEAIRNRRSVRSFKPANLPEELLHEILEAGTWAPSHRNTQPWDFVRVGPQARAKLLKMFQAKIDEILATQEVSEPAKKGMLSLKEDFGGAPCLLAVTSRPPEQEVDRFEFPLSAAMAIQNMWLAAWSKGVGMIWLTVGSAPPARGILEIPEGHTGIALLALGYPKMVSPPPPRNPVRDRLRQVP
jgi:nitroreductase